ncbi:hypothetical protein PRIPAC_97945 [Pristionchus pacificus]|uniref:Chromo domain-containing protein n=1 Tax=Pristionchus pacificus TaxID=54126 RepID=A0A2A6CU20_PRIPA|nr:hypothetical protein PRIPAC_97945 [Pristionchus pacificus]|eukprot:PDM81649.1 hypothetical protein PRIPAC_30630 [Pristionchus pacificus]
MPHRFRMGRTSRAKKDRSGKKDEPLYEVSQITGLKYINGKKHFHVMWKRTGAKLCKKTSRSFEPVENLQKCWDLVIAYEERERTKQFIKNDDGYPAAKLIFLARSLVVRYNNEVIVPELKRKHWKMVIEFDEMHREYARLNAYVAKRIPLVIALPNGVDLHHKMGKLAFHIEWNADEL